MESEIDEIRAVANSYILANLDEFDPFSWENHQKSELRRKAFTELGVYLFAIEQFGGTEPAIRSHVTERVNDPRFPKILSRYPALFRQNAFPCVPIRSTGDLHPATERAIEETVRSPRLWAKERRPHQLIDLLVQCRLLGYDDHGFDLDTILETSNLVYPPDVIACDIDECYRLTHNVMLPTFFGVDHPALYRAPLPYDVEQSITGAMCRYMAQGNADAVIELLIVGTLQRQLPERLTLYAIRWLYEEKTIGTHVVGPELQQSELESTLIAGRRPVEEWGTETRHWAIHYHTNVVGSIMATVLAEKLDLAAYDLDTVSLSSGEFEDVLALGRALDQLREYDLAAAADTLSSVREETFQQFPGVSRRIVEFLEEQQTEDGFGYWVDERRLYELTHGDDSGFDEQLVAPITDRCRTVVDDITSAIAPPST